MGLLDKINTSWLELVLTLSNFICWRSNSYGDFFNYHQNIYGIIGKLLGVNNRKNSLSNSIIRVSGGGRWKNWKWFKYTIDGKGIIFYNDNVNISLISGLIPLF